MDASQRARFLHNSTQQQHLEMSTINCQSRRTTLHWAGIAHHVPAAQKATPSPSTARHLPECTFSYKPESSRTSRCSEPTSPRSMRASLGLEMAACHESTVMIDQYSIANLFVSREQRPGSKFSIRVGVDGLLGFLVRHPRSRQYSRRGAGGVEGRDRRGAQ